MQQAYVTDSAEYETKTTALRFDPKTRYLADVARALTGETFTRYLERLMAENFKSITLRAPGEPDVVFDETSKQWVLEPVDQEAERFENDRMSIANQGELLYSQSEYVRFLMLSNLAPHLLSPDATGLLTYIENRTDLRIKTEHGFKLDRDRINNQWEAIKAAYAESRKKVA